MLNTEWWFSLTHDQKVQHYSKAWQEALVFCRSYGFCTNKNKWQWWERISSSLSTIKGKLSVAIKRGFFTDETDVLVKIHNLLEEIRDMLKEKPANAE